MSTEQQPTSGPGGSGGSGILERFARHRVAPNLVMLLMLLGGIFAISRMNIQFFPNFALDIVTVQVVWTGASAEDIERGITDPLEERLRSVPDLKKITSTSAQGISNITIEFEEGADPILALDNVREQVDTFRNFPADAEKPQISRVARFDPIARVLLYGDVSRDALREWADKYKRELLAAGIDRIDINGLPDQQISIQVGNRELAELNQSLDQIGSTVNAYSRDLPAGIAGDADAGRELRSTDQRRSPLAFDTIPVMASSNTHVTLGDIGTIQRENRRGAQTLSYEGKPAVELLLQRAEHGNSLTAAHVLDNWLKTVRPTLPKGLHLKVYDEAWRLIDERINLLLTNGVGGLLLVLVLLYVFLPSRVAFWVAAGIPAAFLAALALLWLIGGSINMISLFALIMALGVIVDDAIVVGEDADAHYRAGENPLRASEGAARRMFWPVFASSLTTVAAFMPLLAVGGIIGKILVDIPTVMICVLAASLVECFLVLPGHLRGAFSPKEASRNLITRFNQRFRTGFDRRFDHFRQHSFRKAVRWVVHNRAATLAGALASLILVIGLMAGGRIGFTFFPTPEPQVLYANATFVAGTPKAQVNAFLTEIQHSLNKTEKQLGGKLVDVALTYHGSTIGAQGQGAKGDQLGSMMIELVPPDDRSVRNAQFIKTWKANTPLPAGLENFSVTARQAGPPGSDLTIRLIGDNPERLKDAATELEATVKTIPGVTDVQDDLPYGREQLIYHVNATGQSLGLTTADVGRQLRAAFDGDLVQIYQDGPDEMEVRVLLPRDEREHLSTLNAMSIRTPSGKFVPLNQVVDFTTHRGFEALRHADTELAVEVMGDVDSAINNADNIQEALKKDVLPELMQKYGLHYSFEGRQADQRETMTDMKFGLYLGLALMYIVLVWVFSAWTTPFIVMTIIPFGLVGAIFGHWVMGLNLTILSMFGLFGLSGIVVNNAIILVAFYKQQRAKGLDVSEALEEAAVQRLRAVLLTSLTTIGGLMPLMFETSLQAQFLIPMATSISFGLAYATFLVLFIIPALLSLLESAHARRRAVA